MAGCSNEFLQIGRSSLYLIGRSSLSLVLRHFQNVTSSKLNILRTLQSFGSATLFQKSIPIRENHFENFISSSVCLKLSEPNRHLHRQSSWLSSNQNYFYINSSKRETNSKHTHVLNKTCLCLYSPSNFPLILGSKSLHLTSSCLNQNHQKSHSYNVRTTVMYVTALLVLVGGISYAAVPLYRMFCQVSSIYVYKVTFKN